MAALLSFSKYQGLGNDFVIADLRPSLDALAADGETARERARLTQDSAVVRAICDRRFGVGGDGVLALLPPEDTTDAVARMRVLNADGGEAEMCGNGLRCVAKYLYERDPLGAARGRDSIVIETGAGPLTCAIHARDGQVEAVTVDMGRPRLTRGEIPMTGPGMERCLEARLALPAGRAGDGANDNSRPLAITAVSMGNPHAIAFVDEQGAALRALATSLGPALETHAWFPRRTNAEFAHVRQPDNADQAATIELVVWERGCGITLACGTGPCATAVAACLTGRAPVGQPVTVELLGGPLMITVADGYETVYMRGPAVHVFDATLDLTALAALAALASRPA